MNICMVTLDSPKAGIRDGITSHVYHLSTNLTQKGHCVWIIGLDPRVETITWDTWENLTNIGIPCRHSGLLGKMWVLYTEGIKIIKQIDSEQGIDILHGHGGYIAPVAAYNTNIPKILTLHNTYEFDRYLLYDYIKKGDFIGWLSRKLFYPQPLLNLYRKWYYNESTHIISVTKHNAKVTQRKFGVPPDMFTVIPNGFNASEIPADETRPDPEHILYFGRLEPHKGVDVLFEAFNLLLETHPNVTLGIAGDGGYQPKLIKQSNRLDLTQSVSFYGRLDREKLFSHISMAGITIFPSLFEGIPVALFEAAAMHKPIIASRIPGHTELFADGVDCLMFNPRDPRDLTDKLSWMIENPKEASKIGERAHQMIYNQYQWNKNADNTLKVYKKTIRELG